MSESGNIWRPSIEPNELQLPLPGTTRVQSHYTRTSLAALSSNRESEARQNLNRQILAASQAYNDTPKPFSKSQGDNMLGGGDESRLLSLAQRAEFGQSDMSLRRQATPAPSRAPQDNNDMSPRLVHKQYNSPIDLYSMNNIRKTIEAHTELIAPGLKGINFKKHEAPVNKESEVYKLIKEEEKQKQYQSSSQSFGSRLSPISGQPIMLSDVSCEPTDSHKSQASLQNSASAMSDQSLKSCSIGLSSSSGIQRQDEHQQAKRPKCFECGQLIVGPFAKIQNRCVHPHCFNCTTCGSSLKNTGHFTINDKLYCDIHARQVAKMMRIQYNFDERQQQSSRDNHAYNQQQVSSTGNKNSNPVPCGSISKGDTTMSKSPTTISTMFSGRTECETESSSFDKKEIQWAWRPVTSKDSSTLVSVNRSSADQSVSTDATTMEHSLQQHQSGSHTAQGRKIDLEPMAFNKIQDRGTVQDDYLTRCSRVPICVHCHVQIQGPYLMAGKSTWCKLCSQTHFNCSSCHRSLLDTGFVEDNKHKYYCENCFEAYYAPICSKCNLRIKGDCLNALGKQWHPSCFVCGHCRRPFGNSSFYLEDNVPYCERDWNLLFTTKCHSCTYPIEAGDKWILALDRNYHSNCFKCSSCQSNLEGSTFYCKNGKPYCRLHAR